jgi:uncharacterized iron-regulated protein
MQADQAGKGRLEMSERDEAEERRLVDVLRPYQLEKLEENRWKEHWSGTDLMALFRYANDELRELGFALINRDGAESIAREAADVANFCAMIADIALAREGKS